MALKSGQTPLYSGSSKSSPLYYGSSKGSPLYYGSSRPMYYGSAAGKGPAYYGGGPGYYGKGYYYGGPTGNNEGNDDSLVGTITLGRVLRVIAQRWISVLVFLLVGMVVAFAVYRISPTIYESTSEFTMDMRRPQALSNAVGQPIEPDYGSSYDEIFNTRLSDWRSEKIVSKILQQYRANFPASTVSDGDLMAALQSSKIELVRRSRLITISIRSRDAKLSAALANAYAEAIESFTDDENKLRCDKAVAQIHETVEKQRRADEKVSQQLLEFRSKNKIDNLRSELEILQQSLQKTTADILALEGQVTTAAEWQKVLEAAQETPENFGALPSDVPRSSEIGQAYTTLQTAKLERDAMLSRFTKNHPDVRVKEKELEIYKQEFVDVVSRALATANGNLKAYRNQLAVFKANSDRLRANISGVEQQVVSAESGLQQLEREKDVSSSLYKDLLQKENEARIAAEQNNEIVRVGRPAQVPSVPVLPNPVMIFSAGAILSLAAGLLFILMLDHLEDTIVSLSDIEGRLSLKVLAVLPHVRRKKREQVAKFIAENKYSHFAEAVAGLRNLLDSPRYQALSRVMLVMSTQPGEGKTITSCSIAISSAQANKKTLLVDFDLRRPRLARVFGVNLTQEKSFSHYLSKNDAEQFASLVTPAPNVENLDLICSLLPDNVNPASIMGSDVVAAFFAWARENYERVIIDSPPFGIVGDVMTLASLVDSVIIMCCPDRTHFKPIRHAYRTLAEAGATVIGAIVNDVEMSSGSAFSQTGGHHSYGYRSGYGYGYGYGSYGYGYGPKHRKGDGDDEGGATLSEHGVSVKENAKAEGEPLDENAAETQAAAEGTAEKSSAAQDSDEHNSEREVTDGE